MISCVFCVSVLFGSCAWFRLHFLKQGIEPLKVSFPEFAVALEPCACLGQWLRFQSPWAALGIAPTRDEPGSFEHLEMLGNRGLAHAKGLGQFIHRSFAAGQTSEDGATRRVGESGKCGTEVIDRHLI